MQILGNGVSLFEIALIIEAILISIVLIQSVNQVGLTYNLIIAIPSNFYNDVIGNLTGSWGNIYNSSLSLNGFTNNNALSGFMGLINIIFKVYSVFVFFVFLVLTILNVYIVMVLANTLADFFSHIY
jgi:hypothetical protein